MCCHEREAHAACLILHPHGVHEHVPPSATDGAECAHAASQAVALLARSVKEHARRNGAKLGFSEAPGDCLAFTYYRDVWASPAAESTCPDSLSAGV